MTLQADEWRRDAAWRKIIEDYSNRQLTYATDRLPALAGLIAEFGRLDVADNCVAGIWEAYAHNQLLWKQPRSASVHNPDSAPTLQGASSVVPSWSWASVGTSVAWEDFPPKTWIDVLCSIKAKTCSGESGRAFSITGTPLRLRERECRPTPGSDGTLRASCMLSMPYLVDFTRCRVRCIYELDSSFVLANSQGAGSGMTIDMDSLIHNTILLPLQRDNVDHGRISCLALSRDESLKPGVYRRVGIVTIKKPDEDRRILEFPLAQLEEQLQSATQELRITEYIQKNDDGTFDIELI
jgi:hypothetical protein